MSTFWRATITVVLLAGIFFARHYFPVEPEVPWQFVQGFELDGESCNALRQDRETTVFTVTEDSGAVSIQEVAEGYNLEVEKVCLHNERPRDCGNTVLRLGEELSLPLSLDDSGIARPQASSS